MLAAVPRCARALIVASLTLVGAACGGSDAGPTSVTPPTPNPTIVDWTPCPAPYAAPLWVAQQDGTGNWSVVTPTGSSYRFSFLSSKGAIAWVSGPAPYFNSYVYYGTNADLAAYAAGTCNATQRSLTVNVNALASGEQASVSMGWNSGSATGPGTRSVSFSALNSVTDLVAVLSRPGAPAARAIMRRAIPATTTSIDPIDFSSAEAFDLEHPGLTVSGISGEPVTFGQWYYGTNGSRHQVYYGDASATADVVMPSPMSGVSWRGVQSQASSGNLLAVGPAGSLALVGAGSPRDGGSECSLRAAPPGAGPEEEDSS